jgi:hypothetical protein
MTIRGARFGLRRFLAAVLCAVSILGPPASAGAEELRSGEWNSDTVLLNRRQPAPNPPEPRSNLRRQRVGTIDLGIQGGYGIVRGTSRLADGFDHGPSYAFRFRYMLAPSFSLGFSFENQHFSARPAPPSTTPGASDSTIHMSTVSAEGVFFIHREKEVTPYFIAGIGHAAPDIVDKVLGSARVNEGMFLTGGAGFERFIRPRFSLDFSLRGYGLISNSELTSFAQVQAGIHLYPGD